MRRPWPVPSRESSRTMPDWRAADFALRGIRLGSGGRRRGRLAAGHGLLVHGHRPGLLAEQRDPDDADVLRPPGPRRIRIGQGGEVERRDLVHALAPAVDLDRIPGIEHVAAREGRCRPPGNDVDPVHRRHRQHPATAPVPQPDLVFAPRLAGDMAFPVMPVHRQGPPGFPVQDFERRRASPPPRGGGRGGRQRPRPEALSDALDDSRQWSCHL